MLSELCVEYEDHKTLLKLPSLILTYIHNKILIFRDSQPIETLYSHNRDHLRRLANIIQQSK